MKKKSNGLSAYIPRILEMQWRHYRGIFEFRGLTARRNTIYILCHVRWMFLKYSGIISYQPYLFSKRTKRINPCYLFIDALRQSDLAPSLEELLEADVLCNVIITAYEVAIQFTQLDLLYNVCLLFSENCGKSWRSDLAFNSPGLLMVW